MKKTILKKQLEYELKQLKKANDYFRISKGISRSICWESENLGYRKGRVDLLEGLIKEAK